MRVNPINRYCIIFFFIGTTLMVGCEKKDNKINCIEYLKPSNTYKYPILPGTSQWAALTSGAQKLEVCQIPVNVLNASSTEALIEDWMEFPLNFEIHGAANLQTGTRFFVQNFSGLKELFNRDDAGIKLLERYLKTDPLCILNKNNSAEMGDYSLDFIYLEMIIAQDEILNKLDLNQQKTLASRVQKIFIDKKTLVNDYGSIGAGTTLFIGIKIMKLANYEPFIKELTSGNGLFMNTYLDSGVVPTNDLDAKQIVVILNHLKNFIK